MEHVALLVTVTGGSRVGSSEGRRLFGAEFATPNELLLCSDAANNYYSREIELK
jgi:hypothetical protein